MHQDPESGARGARSLLLPVTLGCLALVSACQGGGQAPDDGGMSEPLVTDATEAPRAWTDSFGRAALLVADQLAIEGPKGLLDHIALRQDPEHLDYLVETVPEGFRQVLTKKPGVDYIEIQAGLDAWEMVALERVMVIERPGDLPVRIVAVGNVWWRSTDPEGPLTGQDELRGARLEFLGE